jgi:Rrf2 family protein
LQPLLQVSAKTDYAVRALLELAAVEGTWVKAGRISEAQEIPIYFLENILTTLRGAGLVRSRRGAAGGHLLARPSKEISLAQVIGAFAASRMIVRGYDPEELEYPGVARSLRDVWVAAQASLESALESVTLADIVRNELPPAFMSLSLSAGPSASLKLAVRR